MNLMSKLYLKGDTHIYYYCRDPQFALVHNYPRTKKGKPVGVKAGWTTCRESLIYNFARFAFEKRPTLRINRGRLEIMVAFMSATRKGMPSTAQQRRQINDYVKRGLRIINHFEKRVGWPLTNIKTVELDSKDKMIFLLSGSPRWMRNTFLLSTYLLMFRAGRSPHMTGWRTHKELMAKLRAYTGKDASAIKITHNKWEILLKHRDTLNGDRLVKDNFNPKKIFARGHTHDSVGIEGISRLCKGSTNDWVFLNRFAKACKKKGLRLTVPKNKQMTRV